MPVSEIASLDNITFLKPLTPEQRTAIAKECSFKRFSKEEQIIDRYEDGRDIYFILEGRVRVVNYSMSGREVSFDDRNAGDMFGELSCLDGRPRSANCLALTNTYTASLPPSMFRKIVSETPALALPLFEHLCGLVRIATDRIMDLSTLAANNRVHAEILRLAKDTVAEDGTAEIKPIPIHSDIASRVSTTRETVARVFSDLNKMGLVVRKSDRLMINDYEELVQMVEDVRGD